MFFVAADTDGDDDDVVYCLGGGIILCKLNRAHMKNL